MRGIKFRAWDKECRNMKSPRELSDLMTCGPICASVIDDYVFEQFTGMKDANSVEIYAGDVVSGVATSDHELKGESFVGIVEWDEEDSGFFYAGTKDSWPHIKPWYATEVVVHGNIHENPELVEASH